MESSEKPMARKLHLLDFCAFFFMYGMEILGLERRIVLLNAAS